MGEAARVGEVMPVGEAREQILTMVERVAMVHYHFATTIIEELGEEKGRELIARAIERYGREVGERHRAKVIAAGLEPSCENYRAVPDLAPLAWSPESLPWVVLDGRERRVCPLAKYWIEKGARDIGRLYCRVDQAKYRAFDPKCECRHLQNVLDGDDVCLVVAKKRSEWQKIDGGAL
jgi:L-2-amino-thiazoline-4-carboxylic acid hydrolase